jgi:catechol 2,3-dioxygenase-like lactoylglutathione lyase family enzyme
VRAFHHIAFACRDLEETHRFYHDALGLPLVNTEYQASPNGGWMKHVFYELDEGSCIAFFYLEGLGEPTPLRTAVSTDLGLPIWVNHVAFAVDEDQAQELARSLDGSGYPLTMELDHGWCRSRYFTDPNGILVELCVNTPGYERDPSTALAVMRRPAGAG